MNKELAIRELLENFPQFDRNIAETLLIMHERGKLHEFVDNETEEASKGREIPSQQYVHSSAITVENIVE